MSIITIPELKAKFETGDRPDGGDFVDLIDTLGDFGYERYFFNMNQAGTNHPNIYETIINTAGIGSNSLSVTRSGVGVYQFNWDPRPVYISGFSVGVQCFGFNAPKVFSFYQGVLLYLYSFNLSGSAADVWNVSIRMYFKEYEYA